MSSLLKLRERHLPDPALVDKQIVGFCRQKEAYPSAPEKSESWQAFSKENGGYFQIVETVGARPCLAHQMDIARLLLLDSLHRY
jgi:hypothetical protein